MNADVFDALTAARRDGRDLVLATTVRTQGDPPSAPGNRALFDSSGRLLAGTIGCNGLDRSAGSDARALHAGGERSVVRQYTKFDGEPGAGVVEVFLESLGASPRLIVGGAGPVADALEALGTIVGLRVRAVEPADPELGDQLATLGPRDATVFIDHDDPALVPGLVAALSGAAGYVGVMGSRRHTPGFLDAVRSAGVDVRRLRSPTGLDLGARTPPEIALSILAEVLAQTRGRAGGPLDITQAVLRGEPAAAGPT